jgi:hypothetical protein
MEESQWEQKGNVNSPKAHEFGPPRAAKWFLLHLFRSYVFLSDKVILL